MKEGVSEEQASTTTLAPRGCSQQASLTSDNRAVWLQSAAWVLPRAKFRPSGISDCQSAFQKALLVGILCAVMEGVHSRNRWR